MRAWTVTNGHLYTANPLRMQVAQRLAVAGRRHARHAADQRWSGKPIASHALVFLYQDPPATRTGDGLHSASRLFLAGADVAHLPTILAHLLDRAMEYVTGVSGFDPRRQMCTNLEPMNESASYVGICVSTLHTRSTAAGSQAGPDATSTTAAPQPLSGALDYDTPFRVLGLLTDESRLIVRGAGMAASLDIRTTHTLDTTYSSGHQRWRWMNLSEEAVDDQQLPEIWEVGSPRCTISSSTPRRAVSPRTASTASARQSPKARYHGENCALPSAIIQHAQ